MDKGKDGLMREDFLVPVLVSMIITYGLRFIPTWLSTETRFKSFFSPEKTGAGWIKSVGPSAILSLFLVSVVPQASSLPDAKTASATLAGSISTAIFFRFKKDIVISTIAGLAAYALILFMFKNA